MSTFPWLTVIGAVPLAGALVVAVTPGVTAPGSEADRAARRLLVKRLALVFSLITLGLTIAMMVAFSPHGSEFQFAGTPAERPRQGADHAIGGFVVIFLALGFAYVMHECGRLEHGAGVRVWIRGRSLRRQQAGMVQSVVQEKRQVGYAAGVREIGIEICGPCSQAAHGGGAQRGTRGQLRPPDAP